MTYAHDLMFFDFMLPMILTCFMREENKAEAKRAVSNPKISNMEISMERGLKEIWKGDGTNTTQRDEHLVHLHNLHPHIEQYIQGHCL